MFLLVPVLIQRFSPGYLVFLPPQKSSFQVLNLTQKTSFRYASVSAGVCSIDNHLQSFCVLS